MQEHEEVTKMDQVESMMERPKLYYNSDGMGELGLGLMFVGFGVLQWLQSNMPDDSIWNAMYVMFLWVGVLLATIHFGTRAIKRHITYPRTGFVEFPKRDYARVRLGGRIGGLVGGIIGASIALTAQLRWGSVGPHWVLTTLIALVGLVFAACYAYGFARSVRWKWAVAGAMTICSVVIALLPANMVGAVAGSESADSLFSAKTAGAWLLTLMIYGVLLLISGGISFVLYLRHTQPAAETEE
jgi:hypothetical protein